MKALIAILVAFATAQAATHSATLTWSDTQNPSGTTYTIYRATGLCSGTPTFAMLAAGVTVMNYVDTTVTTGNYCYGVEAVFSAIIYLAYLHCYACGGVTGRSGWFGMPAVLSFLGANSEFSDGLIPHRVELHVDSRKFIKQGFVPYESGHLGLLDSETDNLRIRHKRHQFIADFLDGLSGGYRPSGTVAYQVPPIFPSDPESKVELSCYGTTDVSQRDTNRRLCKFVHHRGAGRLLVHAASHSYIDRNDWSLRNVKRTFGCFSGRFSSVGGFLGFRESFAHVHGLLAHRTQLQKANNGENKSGYSYDPIRTSELGWKINNDRGWRLVFSVFVGCFCCWIGFKLIDAKHTVCGWAVIGGGFVFLLPAWPSCVFPSSTGLGAGGCDCPANDPDHFIRP